ncbi:DUF1206 domain-containing protein [Saccharothrix violaceirubra]|uniref:DUF1206 domain-containing protein n=1 Tax=Saccharothrix violaceirubra TaxID=413306 RepID=UPI0028AA89EA|nr:DUF1206 domain-containing protein [Saccharothrix violaceirubra]
MRRHPTIQVLGRAGMVCYGVVHVLLAVLTAQVVFGDAGEQTDQKGAVALVAQTPFGPVLLWVLAIGLFAFAVWQAGLAVSGYTWVPDEKKRWLRRIGAGTRAVTGVAIGIAAITYAVGSSSSSSDEQQQTLTGRLLELPAGPFLVGAVGLAVIGIGFAVARKGVKKKFEDDLDMGELPIGARRWVERSGQVGWVGKGIAYGVIGVLVGLAAVTHDPSQSGGMDKALHTLAAQPYGVFVLAVVALGFLGFAVFSFAAAKAHHS